MQASAEIDSQTKQCRIRNGKEKYFIDFDYWLCICEFTLARVDPDFLEIKRDIHKQLRKLTLNMTLLKIRAILMKKIYKYDQNNCNLNSFSETREWSGTIWTRASLDIPLLFTCQLIIFCWYSISYNILHLIKMIPNSFLLSFFLYVQFFPLMTFYVVKAKTESHVIFLFHFLFTLQYKVIYLDVEWL
jgi:hypothetical protein